MYDTALNATNREAVGLKLNLNLKTKVTKPTRSPRI